MLSNSPWQQPSTMTLRWEVILSLRRRRAVLSECSCAVVYARPLSRRSLRKRSCPLLGYALSPLYVCCLPGLLRYGAKNLQASPKPSTSIR